jgi:pimeloyl-ACP methyl ester carboxylesterase
MDVQPFQVQLDQATLDDLRDRLSRSRWPDTIPGTAWAYGADLAYMQELTEYWRSEFDWRAQERVINTFPHFRATIDGLGIHFIHMRGSGPNPLPLIVTHGWPGSFVELLAIIQLLADPAAHGGDPADAFDVVVPSLPGYGFSDKPAQTGMHAARIADMWARLMRELGYHRFGAQGGDWGASVASFLGLTYPDRVAGLHLNYIPGSFRPYLAPDAALSEAEQTFRTDRERWYQTEGGYGHVQATKPQTLAYGLNDSPAGLAGWIVEKFRAWSDCGGDVERRFSKDQLLTNITIYWATQTIHSSMRLYYESLKRPLQFGPGERILVPCGVAFFPKEAPAPPREWVERVYDVRRWTEMPRGGHFAAMEEPALLAEDIRAFFRPLRG